MTPEHEAELHERARDNIVLRMLEDLRWNAAANDQPMSDEDFYHVALMTMTDVANTFQKGYSDCLMRSPAELLIPKDGN